MDQMELDTRPAVMAAEPAGEMDRTGFDIGWDHAHHGLVPPPELLLEGSPVAQGWMAGRTVFGGRTLAAGPAVRQALALRLRAWREGVPFETMQLTPHFLAQLVPSHCPVTRCLLGGAAGQPNAPVFERLNRDAAYAAGNVAVLSQAAAELLRAGDLLELVRFARQAQATAAPVQGADAATWWRAAALVSLATPLPFHEAATLPLAALPPNRVRLLNAAQGLQALLSLQFCAPGFAARLRSVAERLPEHSLRHDFNLFVGAMAARVLPAVGSSGGSASRHLLEDAWADARVQRRWGHFALSLGQAGCAALLEQLGGWAPAGMRTQQHALAQAVDGWGLPAHALASGADSLRQRAGARFGARRAAAAVRPAEPPLPLAA